MILDHEILKEFIAECNPFREPNGPIITTNIHIKNIDLAYHESPISITFNENTHISMSKEEYQKRFMKKREKNTQINH